jgi:hypothetical protein
MSPPYYALGAKDGARFQTTCARSLPPPTSQLSERRLAFGYVLILIGLVLVGLGSLAGVYREWIATVFALNLGVSVAAVVLARPAVFRSWVPWVVATLDAGVVLGVMIIGVFAERVSASYTPALVVSWTMFLLLALTAMRFRPACSTSGDC